MKKIIPILCIALLLSCFTGCEKKSDDSESGPVASGSPDAAGSPEQSANPGVAGSPEQSANPDASGSPEQSASPPDASASPEPTIDPGPEQSPKPTSSPVVTNAPETDSSPEPGVSPDPEISPEPPVTDPGAADGINDNLDSLMNRLYANLDDSVTVPIVFSTSLTEEMDFPESGIVYYIGARGLPFTEGLASEAMIGAIAHSVVLLRLAPGADVEGVKRQIREGIDPMKWICNGVTRDEVIVENIGDLVLLVLSPDGPAYREAFFKLV